MSHPFTVPDFEGRAACAEVGGDLFFPEKGENDTARQAKAICRGCGIQQMCLEWALRHGEAGIWGGTSEMQRRRLGSRASQRGQFGWDAA